jgi:hypothetical protein
LSLGPPVTGDRWGVRLPRAVAACSSAATSRSNPRVGSGQPAGATWPGFASVHRPGHQPGQSPGARAFYPCRSSENRWRHRLPRCSASATLSLGDIQASAPAGVRRWPSPRRPSRPTPRVSCLRW